MPARNLFQTIERHDVGLTLRIRPQISEGGAVLLQIFEESSSLVAGTLNGTGPVTNKRSVETVTLVDDGAIIALGGLVQDSYSSGEDKVPVLGDIPVFGQLFRYDNRQRRKTNLFVRAGADRRRRCRRSGQSGQQRLAGQHDGVAAGANEHIAKPSQTPCSKPG